MTSHRPRVTPRIFENWYYASSFKQLNIIDVFSTPWSKLCLLSDALGMMTHILLGKQNLDPKFISFFFVFIFIVVRDTFSLLKIMCSSILTISNTLYHHYFCQHWLPVMTFCFMPVAEPTRLPALEGPPFDSTPPGPDTPSWWRAPEPSCIPQPSPLQLGTALSTRTAPWPPGEHTPLHCRHCLHAPGIVLSQTLNTTH